MRALLAVACASVVGVVMGAWGCSSNGSPKVGKGDTLVHDVDATIQPAQPPPDAGGAYDSPYGTIEGDGNGAYGYSPLGVCKTCACEAGTYCFGGGGAYTTFSGSCTGGSGLSVGCQPLPAACVASPTCDCVLGALDKEVACYKVCEKGGALTVYCPSP